MNQTAGRIVTIGLGSNMGARYSHLEWAVQACQKTLGPIVKKGGLYETAALLPPHAKEGWNLPFLNTVIQVRCSHPPEKILALLKKMEQERGRKNLTKWSPRPLDLDILLLEEEEINTPDLKIPHPEIKNRDFILTPLKELQPSLKIPGLNQTVLELSRKLPKKTLTTWMHILNVTPDSFSDGGRLSPDNFIQILQEIDINFIPIVDMGAESTRPGASSVSPAEEWGRLEPYIKNFFDFYQDKTFRPKLSVDTRYASTAQKAYDLGADIINDVSGLSQEMLEVLKGTSAEYVLMHSMTVPADPKVTLPLNTNPIQELKKWLEQKINSLEQAGICLDRIIFDPGIGFGKTADQSLYILRNLDKFNSFPVRLLVGHSRKSFMKNFSSTKEHKRDPESAGASLSLVTKGVDILRVHEASFHARALRGFSNVG